MAEFFTIDKEMALSRIPHSEFRKLYLCEYNPRPYIFAEECWLSYDAKADMVRTPGRLFGEIVQETYGEAVDLGFGGDMDEWGRTIKRAQPHSENDYRDFRRRMGYDNE